MAFSEEIVQAIWDRARGFPGQDPTRWRKDECGAWIKRGHYENHNSDFGWKIENTSTGGPDEAENLRAFHWQNGFDRASGRARCKLMSEAEGIANKGAD